MGENPGAAPRGENSAMTPPSTMPTFRAFLAVELPEALRLRLAEMARDFRAAATHASWVKPENMHITLRFLGGITEAQAAQITAQLKQQLSSFHALRLRAHGIGAFPSLFKPSVLWVGVETLDGDLNHLQAVTEHAAQAAELPAEKQRFHAHITLARFRVLPKLAPFRHAYEAHKQFRGDEFTVSHVTLFKSDLTREGPRYTRWETFPLSCNPSPSLSEMP